MKKRNEKTPNTQHPKMSFSLEKTRDDINSLLTKYAPVLKTIDEKQWRIDKDSLEDKFYPYYFCGFDKVEEELRNKNLDVRDFKRLLSFLLELYTTISNIPLIAKMAI